MTNPTNRFVSPKMMREILLVSEQHRKETEAEANKNRSIVLERIRWRGFTESILGAAEELHVLPPLCESVEAELVRRTKALEACEATGKHWKPRKPFTGSSKPRCNRCGVRVDVSIAEDTDITYRMWCELLEKYQDEHRTKPGDLPTETQLREAGFYKPDHHTPAQIKPPFSRTWHPIIMGCRHDVIALTAAVSLARLAGALRSGKHTPDTLPTEQNETGRRWSF